MQELSHDRILTIEVWLMFKFSTGLVIAGTDFVRSWTGGNLEILELRNDFPPR